VHGHKYVFLNVEDNTSCNYQTNRKRAKRGYNHHQRDTETKPTALKRRKNVERGLQQANEHPMPPSFKR